MEYPRLVFICPGANKCNGGTYDYEAVQNGKEHQAALDAGYCDSIPEALEAMTVAKEALDVDRFQSQRHELPYPTAGMESEATPGITGLPKRGRPAKVDK